MRFKKKFPCVRQHDSSDCAAAVISTICKHYKKEVSIASVRDLAGTDINGTTVYGLVKAAEKLNFEIAPIRIENNNLKDEFTLPAICQVKTDYEQTHFVVLYQKDEEYVYISDPAKGLLKLTYTEFEEKFENIIILMIPTSEFEKNQIKKQNIYTIFKHLIWPQKKLIILIIIMSFILSIIGILSSLFSKILFDEIIPYGLKDSLLTFSIVFGLVSIVQLFLNSFKSYVMLYLQRKVDIPVLLGYYSHVLKLPMNFFASRKIGDVIARFSDAMTIKEIFTNASVSLVMDIILALVTGIVMYNISSMLFGITVIMVIINIILVYVFKKPYKTINEDQMIANSELNSQLIESLQNIETVKASGDEKHQLFKLEKRFVKNLKLGFKEGTLSIVQGAVSNGIGSVGQIIFMSIGALAIINGDLTIGTLIVFQTLSGYFTEPVNNLVSLQLTFQEAQISIKRLSEITQIETEEEKSDKLIEDIDLNGVIEFKNITFKYGSRPPIIKDFNLTIKQGTKVGIVGESGSGKSSLVKMLLKFNTVNEGTITINGYDINDIKHDYLRNKIGYVPQKIEIFSGSLYENLLVSNRNASYANIVEACKKTGLDRIANRLQGRYFSYIEESGNNLSGGEKQRIAITRALIKEPEIFVFDEATSNLDSFSELEVQKAIEKITKDKTALIIAHRLSTVVNVDQIIVLKEGKIIEIGKHEELMQKRGYYYELVQKQTIKVNETENLSKTNEEIIGEEITYG